MSRTWIYHKIEAPKIVDSSEEKKYHDAGWADTPAKFFDPKDHDIDPDDEIKIQQVGDAIEGVKNSLNYELMTNNELRAYAKKHFDVDLGKNDNKATLINEIEGLVALKGPVNDDSPESN